MVRHLNLSDLCKEARRFAEIESQHKEPTIYGTTDGKAIGTYLEHKFRLHLRGEYKFEEGNSARGIDFPTLGVDMKVTSIKQNPNRLAPISPRDRKFMGSDTLC